MFDFIIDEKEKELLNLAFSNSRKRIIYYWLNNILFLPSDVDIFNTIHAIKDLLLTIGLDNNDEPNNIGFQIEKLADTFIFILSNINDERYYIRKKHKSYFAAKKIYFDNYCSKENMSSKQLRNYKRYKISSFIEERWKKEYEKKASSK